MIAKSLIFFLICKFYNISNLLDMNWLFLFNFEWFCLTNVHNIRAVGKLLENICLGFDQLHLDGKKLYGKWGCSIEAKVWESNSTNAHKLFLKSDIDLVIF